MSGLEVLGCGKQRVKALDITTGNMGGTPSFGPNETVVTYANMNGGLFEEVVTTGLDEPCGIDVIDNYMVVSDHGTGDIIFYDIANIPAVELGRVQTEPGITGVVIGPDGRIWYTNVLTEQVMRLEPDQVISSTNEVAVKPTVGLGLAPNPVSKGNGVVVRQQGFEHGTVTAVVTDGFGRTVHTEVLTNERTELATNDLASGLYFVTVSDDRNRMTQKLLVD